MIEECIRFCFVWLGSKKRLISSGQSSGHSLAWEGRQTKKILPKDVSLEGVGDEMMLHDMKKVRVMRRVTRGRGVTREGEFLKKLMCSIHGRAFQGNLVLSTELMR